MTDTVRKVQQSMAAIIAVLISVGSSARAQELQVTPGKEPGRYLVTINDQELLKVSLTVEGPPAEDESGRPSCRTEEDFFLIVAPEVEVQKNDKLVVAIGSPCTLDRVQAVKNGDRVLIAIELSYDCTSYQGSETHLRRWVAVEVGEELRLVQNSMSYGPYCYGPQFFRPVTQIKPSWQIRGDQLWMSLAVRNFHCHNWGAKEDRGVIDWKVGESPASRVESYPRQLAGVVDEALGIGFLPYTAFNLGGGFKGILAEVPTSMGAPRLLGITDRRGRSALVFLPRFDYEPSLWTREVDPLDPSLRSYTSPARHYEDEWPQLTRTDAFRYSEEFLSARVEPKVTGYLRNRNALIADLSLPCVDAVDLMQTGAASERWLLRVERSDEGLDVQAALIEPCSFGFAGFFGMQEYRLPSGDLSISDDSVRLALRPPQLDVETLPEDKNLFDNISALNHLHSTAAIVMRLDAPTESIRRCVPALPTSGRGWYSAESGGCMLAVRCFSGRGGKYPEDQVPPRFVVPPEISGWCAEARGQSERRSFRATVGVDGAIEDLQSDYPDGRVPAVIVADINRWRVDPARDAAGEPIPVTMSIRVGRGLLRSDPPFVCE